MTSWQAVNVDEAWKKTPDDARNGACDFPNFDDLALRCLSWGHIDDSGGYML